MSLAARASWTLTKTAGDLALLLQRDHDARGIRDIVDTIYDVAAQLQQAASDLECGLVD